MKEASVEEAFVSDIEGYGFKTLKFEVPSMSHLPDRLILEPRWSPAPPSAVELKRPKGKPRKAQVAMMEELRARGFTVHKYIDTKEEAYALVSQLVADAVWRMPPAERLNLPEHILKRFHEYNIERLTNGK